MSDNDPLKLAYEIKAINHEIESIGVKVYLQLTSFIKSLYPSYSHYLESLQASGQLKDLDFDKLVGKIAEREKAFGKKEASHSSNTETLCLAKKYHYLKRNLSEILKVIEVEVGIIIEAGGRKYSGRWTTE